MKKLDWPPHRALRKPSRNEGYGDGMTDVLSEVFAETPVIEPEVVIEDPQEPVVVELVVEAPLPEKQPGMVPIAALLDERDKRKAAEARIQTQEAPQVVIPDPYDDPDGYNRYTQERVDQMIVAQRFETSALIAKQAHGAEVVDAAALWAEEKAKADPSFAAMYMRESHPIDWIVQQHKRDGLYSQIPQDVTSLDDFIEREIAKRGLTAPIAPLGVQPALKAAEPPRSIATDASPASNVVIDPIADFNAIFTKKR
jgi:hypothetical protein